MIWSGNLSTEVKKYDFISKYSDFRQSGHEYGVTVSMDLISYGQRLYLLIWSGNLSTEVKKYDFISKYSDFRQSGHEYGVTVSMDWQ